MGACFFAIVLQGYGVVGVLDEIWAKVGRARVHADEMQRALDAYTASDALSFELHGHHGTATYEVQLRVHERPPLDVALAYADEMGNLRAALDHVVWHLVPESERHNGTAFPVVRNSRDWPSALGHQLRGFPTGWRPVVEGFQPFEYENTVGFGKHPAYVLNELNIRNKHKLLVDLEFTQIDFRVGFAYNRTRRTDDMIVKKPVAVPGRVEDRVVVYRVQLLSRNNDLRIIDIHPAVETGLGFGPRTDVPVKPYPNFAVFVGSIVEALAPAFEGHAAPPPTW